MLSAARVEVKSGQTFKVELENDSRRILHLSQVAFGEVTGDNKKEKGNETIHIYLKFKNDKFVIGTLSQEKFPQVKIVEPIKDEGSSDDEDKDGTYEDEESSEDQAGPSKKRSAESARKTPAPEKKAKLVTPQRTDSKKVGGHIATPHPSKQAKKASAAIAQAKQTPKSGGSSFPCKSCGRSFGSENALQSHSKAKHGAAVVRPSEEFVQISVSFVLDRPGSPSILLEQNSSKRGCCGDEQVVYDNPLGSIRDSSMIEAVIWEDNVLNVEL
ncbi:hypothetical protein V6N13_043020 [Hibiscus sabdariffa]